MLQHRIKGSEVKYAYIIKELSNDKNLRTKIFIFLR